jgi:X-X-X-Leu-X-X-Gly heptad repeat protein
MNLLRQGIEKLGAGTAKLGAGTEDLYLLRSNLVYLL